MNQFSSFPEAPVLPVLIDGDVDRVSAMSSSSTPNLKICKVGYALNPKKLRRSDSTTNPKSKPQFTEWNGGGLADILEIQPDLSSLDTLTEADLVSFAPWDYDRPLESQPDFDVIIHKLTEDIEKEDSKEKIAALENYLKSHPQTKIVDPIESVRKVTSRARTVEYIDSLQASLGKEKCPFTQPAYAIVWKDMTKNEDIITLLKEKNIRYPVICKPIEACGTPNSHSMVRTIPSFVTCSIYILNDLKILFVSTIIYFFRL